VFSLFAGRLFRLLALDIATLEEKRLTLHSAIELNVSLIVSSGPGFASFTRTYMTALSSVADSFFTMGSNIRDSEAALAKPEKTTYNPKRTATTRTRTKRQVQEWLMTSRWIIVLASTD
jgi:hypothetical protein